MCVFAAAACAKPAPVRARTADSFVDSIGLNGVGGPYLFHYGDSRRSLYGTAPVDSRYVMGVRYARWEIRPDTNPQPMINLCRDQGIRVDALVSWLWTDPYVNKAARISDVLPVQNRFPPGAIATIEGNNESDMPFESGDFPRYASSTQAAQANQAALYRAVKADPVFKNTPVIAWTLGKNWPWGGDTGYGKFTSTAFDYESMHSYPSGDTIDGSLHAPGHCQWLKVADSIVPPGGRAKPIVVTETGFQHAMTDARKVEHKSELAQAKQEMMLLAQDYSIGIVRTFLYSVGGEKPWAMDTRADGTPLPAGRALSFLTSTLGEARWKKSAKRWVGPHFRPGTLRFALSKAPDSVHDTLLERSDGSFYLLLWNDVLVWDGKAMTDINNPPVNLTLTCDTPLLRAEISTMNPDGSYTTRSAALKGKPGDQTLQLAVPDSVMIVRLDPAKRGARPSSSVPSLPPK